MKLAILVGNIVRAERRGTNILILQKRAGGHWLVQYWWTASEDSAINAVQGSERAKFSRRDIDPNISLFDHLNLF